MPHNKHVSALSKKTWFSHGIFVIFVQAGDLEVDRVLVPRAHPVTTLRVLRRLRRPDWLVEKMFIKLPLKFEYDWVNTQGKGVSEMELAKIRRVMIHVNRFGSYYNGRVYHALSPVSQRCIKMPTHRTLLSNEPNRGSKDRAVSTSK